MNSTPSFNILKNQCQNFRFYYAIVDCAADPELFRLIKGSGCEHSSLILADENSDLIKASPHIVSLRACVFTSNLFSRGWGNSWASFVASNLSLPNIVSHFRRIAKVRGPKGENWFFRYYDPRVLRVLLTTLDVAQMKRIMGDIGAFWMEDDDPNVALRFISTDTEICRRKFYLAEPENKDLEKFTIQNFYPDERPNSKTTRSTLRIRKDQCDDLATAVVRKEFIKELVNDFKLAFPVKLHKTSHSELRLLVADALDTFTKIGLDTRGDAYKFIRLCVNLGWDFLENPKTSWVNEGFIKNEALGAPTKRFEMLYNYWRHGFHNSIEANEE
ncbi:DUF4123 domain-containing protein [Hahella sp. CR1]|uniref:DUF4123 domain-containing protein n=1 Tax=Hahella sp. CR1 TaxID=2992807 RepID=UPI00244307E4|nr:DUF4123 domain-containing protein [Hahella sp. CR1]MDG9671809.1 DUF4123 domain-containing protein [Hahella sp. CR1]